MGVADERKPRRAFHFVADVQADTREAAAKALRQAADAVERGVLCGGGLGFGYDYSVERKPADVGVTTRHPRCGYPYCACVGECFAASQPGVTAGVEGTKNG